MTSIIRIPSTPPLLVARHHDDRPGWRSGRLELVTLIHVAGLLVFTTWDFGGETDFAQLAISWWGSLALPLTIWACLRRYERRKGLPAALQWLWPLLGFDGLVLLSTLNPSFTYSLIGGTRMLVLGGAKAGWPSSALPALSLKALWQFNAIYLTSFNLVLAVMRRRILRMLLYVLTINALVLGVMGSFQKLAGAPGLYFGLQHSPNDQFFATFIYHNHWAAFMVLAIATALGLLSHHSRQHHRESRRHSPVFAGLVATLFMAASVPLSGSRSCSALVLLLLTGALLHWLWRQRDARPAIGKSRGWSIGVALAVFVIGLGSIYWMGQPVIDARIAKTNSQLSELRRQHSLGNRAQLYADTWYMAQQKPWFGWGLGSYATVFRIFSTERAVEPWFGPPFYAQAHSDWLQALAEVGFVGTALLVLLGAAPLAATLRLGPPRSEAAYLLAGCGLLVLYAAVEFPFANPAVQETFWLCYFTALRYHKLTVSNV